jgi:hypothetical protein
MAQDDLSEEELRDMLEGPYRGDRQRLYADMQKFAAQDDNASVEEMAHRLLNGDI